MEPTPLFERLGGREGIAKLVDKVVENHYANPIVGTRFTHSDMPRERVVGGAVEFFCTGLSGVPTYTGEPLPAVHAGMNVSDQEFNEVLDDILAACTSLGVGELEQAEVLKILYGMKPDVVGH